MKANIITRRATRTIAASAVVAVSIGLGTAASAARRVTLPEGSVIPVLLDRTLSSRTAHAGDRFSATVREGSDDAGIPTGSRVVGVVRQAIAAEGDQPGTLDLDFQRLVYPSGSSSRLTASLIALNAKSVRHTPGGRLVARTDKAKDRLKFVGIGAGAGLVIAAITRSNTIQDVLLGAAAGAIYNEVKKDKPGDVNLKAGTVFGVRLDRPLEFTTNRKDYYRPDRERAASDPYYHGADPHAAGAQGSAVIRDAGDTGGDIGVLIDNRDVRFSGPKPYLHNGTPYAPLAAVAKAAGVEFHYDPARKILSARDGRVRVGVGSCVVRIEGERRLLKAAPEIHGASLYVPMDLLAYIVDGSAYWDDSSRTIVVTTRAEATQ